MLAPNPPNRPFIHVHPKSQSPLSKQSRLLKLLVRNSPRVIDYRMLSSSIIGEELPGEAGTRLIQVHVVNLRAKLGDKAGDPKYIGNVPGMNCRFLTPAERATIGTGD